MAVRTLRWMASLLAALVLTGIALVLWAFWLEPASLRIDTQALRVDAAFRQPLRIAVLSDLHVGSPFNGLDRLREIVARTNAQSPDVVVILGDLVIQGVVGGTFVAPEDVARELAHLRSASGTFAVLGNHDNWLGHDRVQRALTQVDIDVIEGRATRLQTAAGPVWIAGVGDLWTRPEDPAGAIAAANDGAPILLLTHNPDVFPQVPARVTLTIAGHTHGGQVRVPFYGAPIVPSKYGQRYAAGLVTENQHHLFIATGTGTSILPVRFRVPPSIVMLTVTGNGREP